MLIDAARGIAAAHGAGMVHRDVKPGNVMVADSGAVKVLDFGLARASVTVPSDAGGTSSDTDNLAGTPAYMAPEQRLGRTDARSDQFSFGVMMIESLWGARPEGDPPPAAPDGARGAPAWLWRVARRCMADEPEQRYASMHDVVRALERRRVRPRRVLGGSVLVFGLAAIWLWEAQSSVCDRVADRLNGVWDADRRRAGADAFARTGLSYADEAWERATTRLDAYARSWVELSEQTCRAARENENEALLDARSQCLRLRLRELDATTALLTHADARIVEHADDLTQLPSLDSCADEERVLTDRPEPAPEQQAAVEALDGEMARINALFRAGHYPEARDRLRELLPRADATEYDVIRMRVRLLLGRALLATSAFEQADTRLEQAYLIATSLGDSLRQADAATSLLLLHGTRLGSDKTEQWSKIAEAAVIRAGDRQSQRFQLQYNRALAARHRGDYERATALLHEAYAIADEGGPRADLWRASINATLAENFGADGDYAGSLEVVDSAIEVIEGTVGPNHPHLISPLEARAELLLSLARYDESLAAFERALAISDAARGPESRTSASLWNNKADVFRRRGDNEAAVDASQHALAILETQLPADHPDLAVPIINIASQRLYQDRHGEALELYRRGLRILEASLRPGHPTLAVVENAIGSALELSGDPLGALVHYQRAHDIWQEADGGESARVAIAAYNLGTASLALGRTDDALVHLERARRIQRARLGDDHHVLATTLSALGRAQVAGGRVETGLKTLERAVKIHAAEPEVEPGELAEARFALATALANTGGDLGRARALAQEAADAFERLGRPLRHDAVERWLAEVP